MRLNFLEYCIVDVHYLIYDIFDQVYAFWEIAGLVYMLAYYLEESLIRKEQFNFKPRSFCVFLDTITVKKKAPNSKRKLLIQILLKFCNKGGGVGPSKNWVRVPKIWLERQDNSEKGGDWLRNGGTLFLLLYIYCVCGGKKFVLLHFDSSVFLVKHTRFSSKTL